jgi:hypothetical protein
VEKIIWPTKTILRLLINRMATKYKKKVREYQHSGDLLPRGILGRGKTEKRLASSNSRSPGLGPEKKAV